MIGLAQFVAQRIGDHRALRGRPALESEQAAVTASIAVADWLDRRSRQRKTPILPAIAMRSAARIIVTHLEAQAAQEDS